MADETAIIKIQYDADEAVNAVNKLTTSIDNNKARQVELKTQLKENKISQKEYGTQIAEVTQTVNRESFERKKYIKVLQSETGSVKRAKAENQTLREERNKVSSSTRKGRKQIEEYNKKINKNTEAITRNVDKQSKMFMTLEKAPGAFGGAVSGIMAMVKAGLAFIATPLGAVIAAIVLGLKALMSYFKGSEEGQNKLNKIMAIGGAVIGNLGDVFRDFGKLIFDSLKVLGARFTKFFANIGLGWQKVKGVFKDNTAAIEEQKQKIAEADKILTERKNERKKSAEELKNGIKGIAAETKKEIEIAKQLADRQAALDLLQRKFLVDRAKLEAEIAEARAKANDREKFSAEERVKLMQEAIDKENEILVVNEKIAKERFELKRIQNTLSDSTKEDLDEQAQLEANMFNVQKENALKRIRLTSQLVTAQREMNAEIAKQAAEQEKINELDKKLQEEILKRRAEAMDKLAEIEYNRILSEEANFEARKELMIEQAEEELELKLEVDGILQEEIELAEAEHKARLLEIDAEYNAAIAASREANLQSTFESMQAIIRATKGMAGARVDVISDAFAKITTINFKELENFTDTFLAIAQASSGLTSLITANHEQEFLDLQEKKAYELALVGDNKEAQDAINVKYAKKEAELKTKQARDAKTAAIIDATIATALGVVNALANSGNPILGIVMAALIGLLGGYQITSIASQPTPKFSYAKGGIIGGKDHANGGTKFYGEDGSMFEAERGEAMFVMKKDATAEIAALSAINESHGGRSFTGRGSSHLQDGGEVSTADMQQLINSEIQRTPIFVKVGDISTGLTETDNVKNAGVI